MDTGARTSEPMLQLGVLDKRGLAAAAGPNSLSVALPVKVVEVLHLGRPSSAKEHGSRIAMTSQRGRKARLEAGFHAPLLDVDGPRLGFDGFVGLAKGA